jgi:hypothetical protein
MIDLRAESAESLEAINDALHDRWFDVADVEFSESERRARLRFRRSIKGNASDVMLEVDDVDEFSLHETEGIGIYDLNRITIGRDKTVRIKTGIPLQFEMRVSRMSIRLFEVPS